MAFAPVMLRNAFLRLKATSGTFTQYNCQVKRAALVPEPGDETTYRTLCDTGSWTEVGPSTWTLELEGAQGWKAGEGLSRFLFEQEGNALEFQLDQYGETHTPTTDEPAFTGTVRALPGPYGGNVDEFAEFEIALPVSGTPVLVIAAFPASLEESAAA